MMSLWNWFRSLFYRPEPRDIETTFVALIEKLPTASEDEAPDWLRDPRSMPGYTHTSTTAADPSTIKRRSTRESSAVAR